MTLVRGCGTRQKGGCYIEVPLSPHGVPLEMLLCDPPRPVDPTALGISPVGTHLIEVNGVYHVFDWVGSSHYPNVADMVEEIRRFGLSRRISSKTDFSKITLESRIILLHERAWIENWQQYTENSTHECISPDRKIRTRHSGVSPHECCARVWWEDIQGGEPLGESRAAGVERTMPSFKYKGLAKPEGLSTVYKVAIFASFAIPRIVVINDPDEKSHEPSFQKAKQAKVPVRVVEE